MLDDTADNIDNRVFWRTVLLSVVASAALICAVLTRLSCRRAATDMGGPWSQPIQVIGPANPNANSHVAHGWIIPDSEYAPHGYYIAPKEGDAHVFSLFEWSNNGLTWSIAKDTLLLGDTIITHIAIGALLRHSK